MATVAPSSTSNLAINTNAPEYFRSDNHCESVLKRLRGREDLYDVVLVVGDSGKRISAHRLILIASSDYFSALLSGPMRESQEREITLLDVDEDAMEQLVNFCYTGSLELRVGKIKNLVTTANYLQFKEITAGCCEFLQRNLRPSNCLSVAFLAEQLNFDALLHNAQNFIFENFEEFSTHSEFFLLTANQLSEFIANDYLDVPTEEFVFRVLMKWIEYEPENRRKHFTALLAQVRLPLLSPTFLVEEVEPLCNTVESHKLFVNALKSHVLLTSNSTELKNYRLRSAAKHLLGIYKEKQNLAIAGYNLHTKVWTKWNTPISRREFTAALMNDNLILVGGSLNGSPLNTVTRFNLRTLTCTGMAPLQTRRSGHCVAILNGSIYAIGGDDRHQALNSVERSNFRWHPASGTWSFVAPMENARSESGLAVMDGHLYVSGGRCGRNYLKSVEYYDPVENTWGSMVPMKVGRALHCLAAHKGYLFAIGGCVKKYQGYKSEDEYYEHKDIPTERYDPRTEKWTTIPCSPAIYGSTRCASRGPDLFIINNSNIYTISSEGSCDYMKLQKLPKCTLISCTTSLDWVAFPYEFRPPGSWIKDTEY